jgi:hypothetical protein
MALNATTLTNLMDAKAQAAQPLVDAAARAGRKKMFAAVAEAVIEHLTSSGAVTVPALGLISATAGAPVTGIATGTIS